MKKQVYQHPNIKVHIPSSQLLQIGVGDVSNPRPIESKSSGLFEEDEQQNMWGRAWGRKDD